MFASYIVLFTTSSEASPREYPNISRMEDPLAHPELKIGISLNSRSFIIGPMKQAQAGTTLANLWQVFIEQNKSDPMTISPNKVHHTRRVLERQSALLTVPIMTYRHMFIECDLSYMKYFTMNIDTMVAAILLNAFYKSDLERTFHSTVEAGVLKAFEDY